MKIYTSAASGDRLAHDMVCHKCKSTPDVLFYVEAFHSTPITETSTTYTIVCADCLGKLTETL